MIHAALVALSLGSGMVVPVADGPPHFDIETSCRQTGDAAMKVDRPVQSCRDDEHKAEVDLQQRWASFPAGQKQRCIAGASLGGPPSYVEVLTCLEMAAPK
jgi:hypothetical protein